MTSSIVGPPFTPDQVASLNAFQRRGGMHPFTCSGGGGEHSDIPGRSSVLVASEAGWRCPVEGCPWRQDWAHAFMADWSWQRGPTAAQVHALFLHGLGAAGGSEEGGSPPEQAAEPGTGRAYWDALAVAHAEGCRDAALALAAAFETRMATCPGEGLSAVGAFQEAARMARARGHAAPGEPGGPSPVSLDVQGDTEPYSPAP